jgi:poly(hydroxyalkanoate) depolymerase family esterase
MNRCFNLFEVEDTTRGRGEVESIRQMIDGLIAQGIVDPRRVYITGLSAGGAMANAMLGTYPELFSAGAIIAGLPFGAARNVSQAFAAMSRPTACPSAERVSAIRSASAHAGEWPRISVWHGSADYTVSPANADAILAQWRDVHGLPAEPSEVRHFNGHTQSIWANAEGHPMIENYVIAGHGHGTPILVGQTPEACGHAGPFIIEASISSSYEIARFFGLSTINTESSSNPPSSFSNGSLPQVEKTTTCPPPRPGIPLDAESIIASAFRAAGLTRK